MTTFVKRILLFIVLSLGLLYVYIGRIDENRTDRFAVIQQKTGFPFVFREYRGLGPNWPPESSYNATKFIADLACVLVVSTGVPFLLFRKKKTVPLT